MTIDELRYEVRTELFPLVDKLQNKVAQLTKEIGVLTERVDIMTELLKPTLGTCEQCGKNLPRPAHTCPYQIEMNDNNTVMCNCCPECEQSCADDV